MSTAVATNKLTDKEKEELLKEALGNDYATAGNNLPLLKGLIDKIGNIDNVFTLVELLPFFNKLLTIRVFSMMATGASILSIFLIPVSAMIDIINAYQAGRRMYSYRAIAYALTSWAFKKPVVNSSRRLLQQAQTGSPRVAASELVEYERAWKKASHDAISKLDELAIKNNIPKEVVQVFLRAIADNNEQKLCEMLLKGFEKQFSFIELRVWKSNYNIRYPG